ncbi:FAD dependent oxidoreductase [Thermanaeromonas toyohensis ToBE]|uniref:FAD dependent oxidoreductase n=1 Tax=Thermanaeromonas toyohensis ToBE TaxID=698762 RepID=A0A1W1VAE9_9FIRM|nr:FAD-dependent oxidoreductase [Thermanaeromonas toyohensis]SMB90021.1 FAD dependent oxidoreductase [Thermanaeromonas toyohensis ToBE]
MLLVLGFILSAKLVWPATRLLYEIKRAEHVDIVIYGGGLAACAAAWKAASFASDKRVALVVPYIARQYGGLATVGGQNFWDVRYWSRDGRLPQGGSFAHWFYHTGPFYSPAELAKLIAKELEKLPNLVTLWGLDITAVYADAKGERLRALALRSLERGPEGYVHWKGKEKLLKAKQFIDASEDGRLSFLSGSGVTVGRADWPAVLLPEVEDPLGTSASRWKEEAAGYLLPEKLGFPRNWIELFTKDAVGRVFRERILQLGGYQELSPSISPGKTNRVARQQAATLMFKVKGVRPGLYKDMVFIRSPQGVWGAYGGLRTYRENPVVTHFNKTYGPQGFALKPLNAAQDGRDSPEWWVNSLLIFNVDGRAHFRDRGSSRYPLDKLPGTLETDEAWVAARQLLLKPDFIHALRQFPGFEEADLVKDSTGQPVTGDILYLRETVHQLRRGGGVGKEAGDGDYAVTALEVYLAGRGPGEGADADNYVNRIGLGFYWLDINGYRFEDLQGEDGAFRWPVISYLRPDFGQSLPGSTARPENPVYLPFEAILSPRFSNLLVPGVAASISSLAWAELRVLPNQAVLGDAAGVAAAYAVEQGIDPATWGPGEIDEIRRILVEKYGARVDKEFL